MPAKLLCSVLLLSAVSATANEFKVINAKDNRALIEVPQGASLQKGDILIEQGDAQLQSLEAGAPSPSDKKLEGRTHALSWEGSSSTITYDGSSATGTQISISYSRNFVSTQLGAYFQTSSSTGSTATNAFGLSGRFNLTENIPQNSTIPFIEGDVGTISSGSSATSASLAIGVDYFPLQEIAAVSFSFGVATITADGESLRAQTFSLGYRIYFD